MDAYALGATFWSMVFMCEPTTNRELVESVKNGNMPDMYRLVSQLIALALALVLVLQCHS